MLPKDQAELLAKFDKEFEKVLNELFHDHETFSQLKELDELTSTIKSSFLELYKNKFPKKCNNCQKVYSNYKEYLNETTPLEQGSTVYLKDFSKEKRVHQYRNCKCGSTILIFNKNRRDESESGILRRKIFDVCVENLKKRTSMDEDKIKEILRKIFNQLY